MDLLIVGSIAYDTLKTPRGSVKDAMGGAAVHGSLAASRLCKNVSIAGVVGSDYRKQDLALLREQGIDISGVETQEGRTFRWSGAYEGDMAVAKTLNTELGVFGMFDPMLPQGLRRPKLLFLANIHPSIQMKILKQTGKPAFTLLDTMNYWIASQKAELVKVVRLVDGLIVNDQEIRQLTGQVSLVKAVKKALGMGPKVVVLKRGEHGASLHTAKGTFQVPAFPVENVVDPTGAGDSFAGGFIGHLARGKVIQERSLREAMLYGTAVASLNVEDFSVRRVLKSKRQDVEARVLALKRMMAL
jgi:sugar/nucleoside kinase (ribokinase family)